MVSTGSTLHGGPDALGAPAHDFSTNVNAVGPCPAVLAALQQQVPDTYPDPAYTDLRARLASWHGVHPDQIVIGASGSELISRLTAAFFRVSLALELPLSAASVQVWLPAQAYGDYRRAAEAWGLPVFTYEDVANTDALPDDDLLLRQGVRERGRGRQQTAQQEQEQGQGTGHGPRPEQAWQGALQQRGPCQGQPFQIKRQEQTSARALEQIQEPARSASASRLIWACDPSSPLGQTPALRAWWSGCDSSSDVRVLDAAYAPLRLSGHPALSPEEVRLGWLLVTPNKALGLTGIRAAYLVAPEAAMAEVGLAAQLMTRLHQLSPSWPIGTHGVTLLDAWVDPAVQHWLAAARDQLREWKAMQIEGLLSRGWTVLPSEANHFCARPPVDSSNLVGLLARLRSAGIKLRDARSFGLGGWVRLGVRTPADQQALWQALDRFGCTQGA